MSDKKIIQSISINISSDVNMLNSDPQPPVANEYKIRRTVLKSRHPLPLWNGFNLICEMFKRRDENATMLLHMITIHCLSVDQVRFEVKIDRFYSENFRLLFGGIKLNYSKVVNGICS